MAVGSFFLSAAPPVQNSPELHFCFIFFSIQPSLLEFHGWINLLVHRSQSLGSCCFIEPLAIKSGSNVQVSYKRNEVDVFKGRALRQCEGVKFKQIKRLKIRNLLYKEGNRPDGWQGDYIDIGFHNGTRFCDIELTDTDMNFSKTWSG